jgi:hypothetical protein
MLRLPLVQLFQQPSHVTFGLTMVKHIAPTVEFSLMSRSRSASVTRLRFPMFGTRLLPNAYPKLLTRNASLGHAYPRAGYGERTPQRRVVE